MSLSRVAFEDSFVELALGVEQDLLQPGAINEAQLWVAEHNISPQQKLGEAAIWFLTSEQMAGFAEDFTIPTPERYPDIEDFKLTRYGVLQLALASTFGNPFGIPSQRNGVIIQDVFPREDLLDRVNSGLGAHRGFNSHTDQAFSPDKSERPDYVTLGCVRNNEAVATGLAKLANVLGHLSRGIQEQLMQTDYSFYRGRAMEGFGTDRSSVLIESASGLSIRLGGDTAGVNESADRALIELKKAIDLEIEHTTLEPGEVLAMPNRTTIHSRDGFKPLESLADRRWIQKIYVKAA